MLESPMVLTTMIGRIWTQLTLICQRTLELPHLLMNHHRMRVMHTIHPHQFMKIQKMTVTRMTMPRSFLRNRILHCRQTGATMRSLPARPMYRSLEEASRENAFDEASAISITSVSNTSLGECH